MSRNQEPLFSIIVPCGATHADCLVDCLVSLEQLSMPRCEVIVVNSHAERAVAKTAKALGARVVDAQALTAGAARNLGVKSARAGLIGFIDADCVAEPGWLSAARAALEQHFAVGGPVLNCFPLHPIATMDNLMQFIDQSPGRPAGRAGAFPGCNMAIRKKAFLELGGFDERIQPGEDTLLTNRAAKLWPDCVRFVPRMRVRHQGRRALPAFAAHQYAFGLNRGRYGLHLTHRQQRLGRWRVWAVLSAGKRFGYFVSRTARWDQLSLLRLIIFSPILLIGLGAWTRGFNAGCRAAAGEPAEQAANSRG